MSLKIRKLYYKKFFMFLKTIKFYHKKKLISVITKSIIKKSNCCPSKKTIARNHRDLTKSLFLIPIKKSHFKKIIFLGNPVSSPSWTQNLIDFYHIWPWHQWLTSLVSLILLYWITGHFYNKWLSNRGGWLTFKMRVWLIISDLTLNLALGLYYMHYRESLMGAIMLTCPIAISPVIFILEMICVYVYYRFWRKK